MKKRLNFKTKKIPELVAPAGNLEKMKTAFAFGADAVYAGIPDFSLRVRINDFDLKSLAEAIRYVHAINKKIYITINIFAHNRHLKALPKYIAYLKKHQPDGLIVSDPGIISEIKKRWPTAKIHLSTQANCTNWQAASFWRQQGIKRIVLGREMTLEEIKATKKKVPAIELETFVHGAMCMAYSGRCFLSKYYADRSANLGDCAQPCRWEYTISHNGNPKFKIQNPKLDPISNINIKEHTSGLNLEVIEEPHGSYILNSQDLCLIKRLPDLIDAGISALKIEGRAKSVYYIAAVVGAYRTGLDILADRKQSDRQKKAKLAFLYQELSAKIANRGYTEGFVFGQGATAQNLADSHKKIGWEFCGQVVGKKGKITHIKVHNSLSVGDQIEAIVPGYDIIRVKVDKIIEIETGENIAKAHGGQNKIIGLKFKTVLPQYSVIRRKVN